MIKNRKIILLLGGNIGNVKENLSKAINLLTEKLNHPNYISGWYESEPWGFVAQQNFINQVVEFSAVITPIELLNFTQSIENQLGRLPKSGQHYESRTIDIDILFIDNCIIESERLTVPHPLLHRRRFTMMPLMEYWSGLTHPGFNQTISELFKSCEDLSPVKKVD